MDKTLLLCGQVTWFCIGLLLNAVLHATQVRADDLDIYREVDSYCVNPLLSLGGSSLSLTTLALSANNETRFRDSMFISLFERDAAGRWYGNLKKLALHDAQGNGVAEVLDVPNLALALKGDAYTDAINNEDGRIKHGALTFWTIADLLPGFLPGLLRDLPDQSGYEVSGTDGPWVRRGGAGQLIPQFISGSIDYSNTETSRQIYTDNAAGNALQALDASDENAIDFYPLFNVGTAGSPAHEQLATMIRLPAAMPLDQQRISIGKALMHYARGVDIGDAGYNVGDISGPARNWLLGDIIHATPLVLDYGNIAGWSQPENPYLSIIFGANDGMLHVLANTDAEGNQAGHEQYAFLPRELFPLLPVLANNNGNTHRDEDMRHPAYGMDGAITALVFDDTALSGNARNDIEVNRVGNNGFAYIYAGMRRGGKSYYALDVTDPLNPPALLGSIRQSQGDFAELGLSFSAAVPALVKFDGNVTPVLVFAGGYDAGKDDYNNVDASGRLRDPDHAGRKDDTGFYDNTHGKTPDAEGNAIYIVHAVTLELIWKATNNPLNGNANRHYYQKDLAYAIPSTVKLLDSNGDGFMDRLYVGDIAGNVWRGDFPECGSEWSCSNHDHRREHWSLTRLAAFATLKAAGDTRFFHPPAVVLTHDKYGDYDGVVIGSGDRENPLEVTDRNRLYLIKDRHVRSGSPSAEVLGLGDLADVSRCVMGNETGCGPLLSSSALRNGWRIDLNAMTGADGISRVQGEKALSQPLVVGGKIYLTTYIPSVPTDDNCSPVRGISNLYLLHIKEGTAAHGNTTRYIKLGEGMAGDVSLQGQNIQLPGKVPLDFILPADEIEAYMDEHGHPAGAPVQSGVSWLPAGVSGSAYSYWHEKDIHDIH